MTTLTRRFAIGLAVIAAASITAEASADDFEDRVRRYAVTLHWNETCGGNEPAELATPSRNRSTKEIAGMVDGTRQVLRALSSTPGDRDVLCTRLANKYGLGPVENR